MKRVNTKKEGPPLLLRVYSRLLFMGMAAGRRVHTGLAKQMLNYHDFSRTNKQSAVCGTSRTGFAILLRKVGRGENTCRPGKNPRGIGIARTLSMGYINLLQKAGAEGA